MTRDGDQLPSISVVMPVHSAMPFLHAAIESVLAQDFRDFEFVIGDDGSTDGSWECILAYAARDARIRPIRSAERLGPVASSNWVARAARAPLVARMDGDDVCEPHRLRIQWERLQQATEVVAVGSLFEMIDAHGEVIRPVNRVSLMRVTTSPCAHASLMVRRPAFDLAGGYREGTDYYEDFDLYQRLSALGHIEILGDALVRVRASSSHARLRDDRDRVEPQIASRIGVPYDPDQLHPGILRVLATLRLWSGRHQGYIREMLRRVTWAGLISRPGDVLYVSIVSMAPAVLRQAIRLHLRWRNWRLRKVFPANQFHRWSAHPESSHRDHRP